MRVPIGRSRSLPSCPVWPSHHDRWVRGSCNARCAWAREGVASRRLLGAQNALSWTSRGGCSEYGAESSRTQINQSAVYQWKQRAKRSA